MSPSGVDADATVVDLPTLSPPQQTGWRHFYFDAVDTCCSFRMVIFSPCLLSRGRSAQEEAEQPEKWKDEEE